MKSETINYKMGVSLQIVVFSKEFLSDNEHSMFRIVIIKSGSGIIKINDSTFIFMAPSILCLNEKDKIYLEKDNSIDLDIIGFLPNTIYNEFTIHNINNNIEETKNLDYTSFFLLMPFLHRDDYFNGMLNISYTSINRFIDLTNSLKTELANFENNFWRCRTRSFFLEILFFIQYLYTDHKKEISIPLIKTSNYPEINEVLLYIHTNYSNKITIEELSKKYNLNRTTLSERFLSETGYTIKRYLTMLRIKVSSMLLEDTQLPISEIAYRVGFNDITHFTRTFKKHVDVLPSKYRENALK